MTTTILDIATRAAAAAATTQEANIAAAAAPFGASDVTVRCMAGATIAETCTYGPLTFDTSTPRGMALGALSASTVNVSGATVTSYALVAAGTPILSVPAADLVMASPVTQTGRRTHLNTLRITANSDLPLAFTYLLTFAADDTATVNVDAAGSLVNGGTGPCVWSITPPTHVTVTPSSGTLAAGATQTLVVSADTAGTYTLTVVSVGSTITGNGQSIVVAAAPTYLATFSADDAGTVNANAAGSIVNTGTGAVVWSITPPSNVTVTPSSGTLAAGATQSLVIVATVAGTYSLTLTSVGTTTTGNPQSIVVAAVPTTATLSGSTTAGATVAQTYTVTLDVAADQTYTITPSASDSGVISPTTRTITAGNSTGTFTVTWPVAGAARSVDFTISPTLTRAGRPISVTVAPAWSATIGLTVGTLPSAMSAGSFATLASGSRVTLDYYGLFAGHGGLVDMPGQGLWYFGSETHSQTEYYTNSPYHINTANMTVYRDLAHNAISEYRIASDGTPWGNVAHTTPWAIHAFKQMWKIGSEWVVVYPTPQHAYYLGSFPPTAEGSITDIYDTLLGLWYYNPATATWRFDSGGGSNAAVAAFLNQFVGYGLVYIPSRGSLCGIGGSGWRELNVTTYAANTSSAPSLGGNTTAELLADGMVLVGFGASGNTSAYTIIDPASPASATARTKASLTALSSYSTAHCPFAVLPSGTVVLFVKDQSNNTLRAFLMNPSTEALTDTGHTLAVGATGVNDNTYWMQCTYCSDAGVIVLTTNIDNTLSVFGYKPSAGA